eukprot:7384980-Prymnesium_polylepis.4
MESTSSFQPCTLPSRSVSLKAYRTEELPASASSSPSSPSSSSSSRKTPESSSTNSTPGEMATAFWLLAACDSGSGSASPRKRAAARLEFST